MKKIILSFLSLLLFACSPVPTPLPLPTNTISPTLTITPSKIPTATPTAVPDGPCDNPLVPLGVGNQWTYHATTDGGERIYNLEVLEMRDIGNLVAVVEFGNELESVQESVVCLDGAIENFPLFVMDMLFADALDKFFDTYHNEGVYAPAHQTFAENDWSLNWEVEHLTEDTGVIENPSEAGPSLYVLTNYPIGLFFEMDGTREAVTVPAGEFPMALKVLHSFNLSVSFPTGSGGFLTIFITQWYVPYVGLIRAQVDSASLRIGVQEFGVPLESVVELIEFQQGQ